MNPRLRVRDETKSVEKMESEYTEDGLSLIQNLSSTSNSNLSPTPFTRNNNTSSSNALSTLPSSRNAFFFTEHPHPAQDMATLCLVQVPQDSDEDEDQNQIQNDADNEEVIAANKSFELFEKRLKEGFLEASNLGLVCAPPAMFDYQPPLNRVDLRDNKIEVLPDHFFDELPSLQWCDLRYNRLKALPTLNRSHDKLNVLLLQDNDLVELPCSIAHAVNLQTLGWTNNDVSDPPPQILLQGCSAILRYLKAKLAYRLPLDDKGNLKNLEGDEDLRKDLAMTKMKRSSVIKKKKGKSKSKKSKKSCTSFRSSEAEAPSNSEANRKREELEQKRRIDRLKYTWDLWKSIPYDGVSNQKLFERSVHELKDEVLAQFNRSKESILQKMKNHDALGKWRWDTRVMQSKGPLKPYAGVTRPFGSDADYNSGNQVKSMTPEVFRSTLADCLKKLQSFAETPAPLNDPEKSMQRLREVEDVQKQLLNMKISWAVKSSTLV